MVQQQEGTDKRRTKITRYWSDHIRTD